MRSRELLLACVLAATPAMGASAEQVPGWHDTRLWAGYRFTAGSSQYYGHTLALRGEAPLFGRWTGYSRLEWVTDRTYDRAWSWVAGGERDLPKEWQAWGAVGFLDARYKDGTGNAAFRSEAGTGHPLGRWWADVEWRLLSGRVGDIIPERQLSNDGRASAPSGLSTQAAPGPHQPGGAPGQPFPSAPSATLGSFTQNEVELFVASPFFQAGFPMYIALSGSYWTRTDGVHGFSPGASLNVRVTRRLTFVLSGWSDAPSGADDQYYGSASIRYAVLPLQASR